ncbi:MAG TPA: 3-hydroxyacyl-CoA dehydrogenase NAD-binding domain-containing protein [Bacteroidia bacterium]|jgi:3-hydroxybutyryl-CoA dehydrogenase|nr:3-hydroxyacyl-CoA dehydrogenase NAD-binding domain-containing protein [Bacteroidia bacterium]
MIHPSIKELVVGIVGSGAMGSGIAQVAATVGHTVFIYDNNKSVLDKAASNLNQTLKKLVEKQKLTQDKADGILTNIRFVTELKELATCGLIIEAIVENLEIKQKVFAELEACVADDCILASNTSSLSIASIASACKKTERVLGIHFFNPAPLMPLVEIIPAITSNTFYVEQAKMIIDSWGKVTVLTKDTPGFIVNRVARSYYGESIRIYEEGIADFATIDWAMKSVGDFKMGPFELMDFIGNDVNYKVSESVWEQFFYEPRFKPSLTQKRLYEAKLFGRKSGKGYYDYAEGAAMPAPKKDDELAKSIFYRVISMLINEAIDSLHLQLATKEDIDLAMTKGVNYPKGLLKWGDELGLPIILDILTKLQVEYGEDRYRPSVLLKRMVREEKTFY